MLVPKIGDEFLGMNQIHYFKTWCIALQSFVLFDKDIKSSLNYGNHGFFLVVFVQLSFFYCTILYQHSYSMLSFKRRGSASWNRGSDLAIVNLLCQEMDGTVCVTISTQIVWLRKECDEKNERKMLQWRLLKIHVKHI